MRAAFRVLSFLAPSLAARLGAGKGARGRRPRGPVGPGRFTRAAVRLLAAVAPGRAEQLAVRVFKTPPRPPAPEAPQAPGIEAVSFEVPVGSHRVAAWAFGRGPAILLVHGWGGRAAQLSGFIRPLVLAGYRVVTFDHPAHGHSSGRQALILDLAAAVAEVGRRAGPLAGIVAHSLGGVATTFALAGGLEAGKVVLIAPPAEFPPFARAVAARLGLPAARHDGVVERIRREIGRDLAALDLRRIAPRLRPSLLLFHDPEDAEVPFDHGRAIALAWPGGKIVAADGLGHRRILRDAFVIASAVEFMRATGRAVEPALLPAA